MKRTLILVGMFVAVPALAQQSASYKLGEHAFNAGGHPAQGTVLSSSSYRVTLDALGDGVVGRNLASASYRMDGGFIAGYPPPGEIAGLSFSDVETLVWSSERSAGAYKVYRDSMSSLSSLGYGICEQQGLLTATTTDIDAVPVGEGFFYLVTVENRLGEEGTKGWIVPTRCVKATCVRDKGRQDNEATTGRSCMFCAVGLDRCGSGSVSSRVHELPGGIT